MGMFLAMSGVIGKSTKEVIQALQDYTKFKKGTMEEAAVVNETFDLCVVGGNDKNTTVVYPDDFFEWDEASEYLSKVLNTSVFSFHIHDSDLWMYIFYNCGNVEDKFNPIPNYWEELSQTEIEEWRGKPEIICNFIQGVLLKDIENYYKVWDEDDFNEEKAYEEDEFGFGEDWQVVDFMDKLNIIYPFDKENGFPIGKTYKFTIQD
ncbi:hypothetical protein Ccar_09390 [Clostridium carboxidivorans P7]|uniref:Uncharacterized protein n=1 Tax=Clostridium carboxidivorans P7 TaxID=536227 RepID=C6PRM4_9CLOT|nr:hypothetical protein [Clostridium carboxidivorans]AKN31049.1 hypothetical protein Ccar_09390 [Clostridium carboxidivorans P7]EET88067.1 hypothetical protein CcarbDRAFT_1441 [Clostridium carboxidivorans P7]EFG88685.1 hypothetical protein CLCAR_1430 [Clostridium carboxidivorans P7]